jgi:hypothetical protein
VTRACVIASIATIAAAATLNAHGRVIILMELDPPQPVYDEDCRVTVRFMSTAGDAVRITSDHVELVATMSGHAMPPVEAMLTPGRAAGTFVGTVRFTMAGPWKIAVDASSDHDLLAAAAHIVVIPEPSLRSTTTVDAPIVLEIGSDGTEPPAWAWPVLLGTLLITAVAETIAIRRKAGNTRRT